VIDPDLVEPAPRRVVALGPQFQPAVEPAQRDRAFGERAGPALLGAGGCGWHAQVDDRRLVGGELDRGRFAGLELGVDRRRRAVGGGDGREQGGCRHRRDQRGQQVPVEARLRRDGIGCRFGHIEHRAGP